ncbi:MAG: DUF4876 domain-containing protein [Gemmatimonadales bacterium]|jgi:hypothetical protein
MNMGASILRVACPRAVLPAVCVTWLLTGCTAGEVELYEPEGSGLAQGLTVKVVLDSTAADIAEALGWTEGVPEAEVRVHRLGTEFRWQTVLTDSAGEARFPDLIPGRYRLAGYRVLTDEEAAQLGSRRRAFGDGLMLDISGARTKSLHLAPDRRGALLISELYGAAPLVAEVQWTYHHYLEVYNNSDTTVYPDGMILGWAFGRRFEYSNGYTCLESAPFRNDPDGVWSMSFHQFPGSGAEYPLAPGQNAVVAIDAIDHSQIHPSFPDLTHADFELLGPADVDNPAVPNMPDIGLEYDRFGHGMTLWIGWTFFLSQAVDIGAILHAQDEWGREWVRFPGEALLDVLATEVNDALDEQNLPRCRESVHRNFDRLAGGFARINDLEDSVQRLVSDYTPDGRAILQDTNTSAVDLIRALYTVGTLPQPQLGGARRAAGKREH